jgi:hypothetical protein
MPLPENGKPRDFSGLVGKFAVTAKMPEKSATAGKPIALVITVSGAGNLQSIPRPKEPHISGAEKYEPEIKDEFSRTERGSEGGRTYTHVLVPQKEGILAIGPFTTNYFDPKTGKYVSIATEPMEVTVAPAPVIAATPAPSPRAEKPQAAATPSKPLYMHPAFFAVILTLFIALAAATVHLQRRNQILRDQRYARQIRARSLAEEKLKSAQRAMEAGDPAMFYETLEHSIRQYISDRFNIPPSSVTPEGISRQPGIGAGRMQRGIAVMEKCIAARYAPAPPDASARKAEMKTALEEAIAAVEEAEKEL